MPATKREYSSTPSDPPETPKKSKSSKGAGPSTPKSKKKAGTASMPGSEGKKTGAWSGDELKMLYSIMCPKRTGVKWNEVAGQIPGRDAKSCNNKWSRMQGKIMEALENMGE